LEFATDTASSTCRRIIRKHISGKAAAALGSIDAMNGLGILYYRGGFGVNRDEEKALHWYEKAAAGGSTHALFNLGLLFEARRTPESTSQAFSWYQYAAAVGMADAMHRIGNFYYNPAPGLKRDFKLAPEWYQKAANAGDTTSMFNLGLLYERGGFGLKPDYEQARRWYQQAAAAGDADAAAWLSKHAGET
jgi:TPR repeat protein